MDKGALGLAFCPRADVSSANKCLALGHASLLKKATLPASRCEWEIRDSFPRPSQSCDCVAKPWWQQGFAVFQFDRCGRRSRIRLVLHGKLSKRKPERLFGSQFAHYIGAVVYESS